MGDIEGYKKYLEGYASKHPDEKFDFKKEAERVVADSGNLISLETGYRFVAVKYGMRLEEDEVEAIAEETKSKSKPIPISVTEALDEKKCSSQGKPLYLNVRGIVKRMYGPKAVEVEEGTNYATEVYLGDLNNQNEIKITCWNNVALLIPNFPIGADVMITSVLTKRSIGKDNKDYGIQGSTQKYSTVILEGKDIPTNPNILKNDGPATFGYEPEAKGGLDI